MSSIGEDFKSALGILTKLQERIENALEHEKVPEDIEVLEDVSKELERAHYLIFKAESRLARHAARVRQRR
jgi:hypothetical protein